MWLTKFLWKGKWYILGIGIAVGIGFGAYHLVNKVESLSTSVALANNKISTLETSIKNLKAESAERESRMNQYFDNNKTSQRELDKKVAQLDKALGRQKVIAAKPGLVTIITKKQSKEFEEKLSCLTGEQEYCLQPQSSQAVQQKK